MDEFEANPTESPLQRLTWYRAADSRSLESDEKIAEVAAPAKMEVAAAPQRLRQGKGTGTRPAPRPPDAAAAPGRAGATELLRRQRSGEAVVGLGDSGHRGSGGGESGGGGAPGSGWAPGVT